MEMLAASMLLLALFVNMSAFRIISNISVYLITASIVGLIPIVFYISMMQYGGPSSVCFYVLYYMWLFYTSFHLSA